MCTTQMYRIVDLEYIDRNTGTNRVWITKAHCEEVDQMLKHPLKWKVEPIPCGNCMECRIQHAKEWAFRCMKEAKEYENNVMLTLTYNDEHIPKGRKIDAETGEIGESYTLCKRDVQLFLKRLRKAYNDQKIRYYMCGEYGEQFGRPHYHIIIFNLKVEDMKPYKISKTEWSNEKNVLYKSKTIDRLWGKGFVDLNEVNYETCAYVARYVTKKYKASDSADVYEMRGQVPEYTCMSRKPGIGYAFYERNKEKFENEETFWQVTKKGLQEMKPGRYFDKQLEKDNPERMEEIKRHREEQSKAYWQELMSKTDINKTEYVDNRISKGQQKYKLLKRTLAS